MNDSVRRWVMMNKQETIDSLREKANAIHAKIDGIEGEQRKAAAAKLVGKCFRYRNCYSCPQTDADYWWIYRRVTLVDKHGWLRVFEFQTDRDGKTWIEPSNRAVGPELLGEPITLKQFRHAWRIQAGMLNRRAIDAGAYVP